MSDASVHCEHCGEEHPAEVQRCPHARRIVRPERFYPLGSMLGGKYRIERVLGSGGMAAVFLATHTLLRKEVALKILTPQMVGNAELVARMVREARSASSAVHINIAQVTDMGLTEEGALYIVMELVEGETLTALVKQRGRLPVKEAVLLMDQVLAGLSAVHAQGIVHRDLKPDNVMLHRASKEPVVKILDFGIAKPLQDDDLLSLTRKGRVVGTPRYMAPEQALGKGVTERSDIFAAGALLYLLLTGKAAIGGQSVEEVMANVRRATIVPPSVLAPAVTPELERVILRAMAADPEQRIPDARAFRHALAPFLPAERKRQPSVALAKLAAEGGTPSAPAATLERRQQFVAEPEAEESEAPTARFEAPQRAGPLWPAAPSAGDLEQSLQLNLDAVPPKPPVTGQLYESPTFWRRHRRTLLVVAALLLLSLFALTQHRGLRGWIKGRRALPAEVLIVIEPSPKRVRVTVDGQPHDSMTVRLLRSQRDHLIRVEARGYRPKQIKVRASATQLLRVRLERLNR